MADYVRQMPHQGSDDMARPPSTARRFHIDVPLLLLLMALTVYGLFVLYSASGQSMGAVIRQGHPAARVVRTYDDKGIFKPDSGYHRPGYRSRVDISGMR